MWRGVILASDYPIPFVITSVYGRLKAEKLGLIAWPRRQGAASRDSSGMASSLKAWARWVPSRTNESWGITRSCSVGVWFHGLILRWGFPNSIRSARGKLIAPHSQGLRSRACSGYSGLGKPLNNNGSITLPLVSIGVVDT